METLPPELWKTIFGFVPVHQFAVRCTCKAWRAWLGEKPARTSLQTILEALEAGSDPAWLKKAVAGWGPKKAKELLFLASTRGNTRGITLAKAWGATQFDAALRFASRSNQLEAMKLLSQWGASRNCACCARA